MTNILIYTDGSSTGKVGDGGWGFVVCIDTLVVDTSYGSALETTNNRMELTAVIESLRWCISNYTDCNKLCLTIYSDSQYVINGCTIWKSSFEEKILSSNKFLNKDLWIDLFNLIDVFQTIDFCWLRGHAGHEFNEKADGLAKEGKRLAKINAPQKL